MADFQMGDIVAVRGKIVGSDGSRLPYCIRLLSSNAEFWLTGDDLTLVERPKRTWLEGSVARRADGTVVYFIGGRWQLNDGVITEEPNVEAEVIFGGYQ